MSQQLDRGKPLWEMWVVEGLEGDRFAIITKAHHCMIDGVGSVELTGSVMRPTPDHDPRLDEPPPRWMPRPAPRRRELLADELSAPRCGAARRRGARPARALARPARRRGERCATRCTGIGEALGAGFRPASPTPLNVDIGPHRRFDWTEHRPRRP